jgi:hypothetical protein
MEGILMKRRAIIAAIMAVLVLSVVSTADASESKKSPPVGNSFMVLQGTLSWTHLGGYPLVTGGAPTKAAFCKGVSSNSRVIDSITLIAWLKGYPSWIAAQARVAVKAGEVYKGSLGRDLDWLCFAPRGKILIQKGRWLGSGSPKTFCVIAKAPQPKLVKIKGCWYQKTLRYQVYAPKKCFNVRVRVMKPILKRLYELKVEKRLDCATGTRIENFLIKTTAGGKKIDRMTKSTGSVSVGFFLPGTPIKSVEENQAGYIVVVGSFDKLKMPRKNLTLTFINKKVCTPTPTPTPTCTPTPTPTPTCTPPAHKLEVCASYKAIQCMDFCTFSAMLKVQVVSHSDDDLLTFTWDWGGGSATTRSTEQLVYLYYDTDYTVTVTARDEDGNTAWDSIYIREEGPNSPPPPPMDTPVLTDWVF